MALTDTDYTALSTEITTDPEGLGYSGKTYPEIADLLNTVGLSSEQIGAGAVDGQELSKAVVISEYLSLTDAARAGWTAILTAGNGQIDAGDSNVVAQIAAIWGVGTTTRANLLALATRSASRAEVLFGSGVIISKFDVAEAG